MNQSFPLRYSLPVLLLVLGGTLAGALMVDGMMDARRDMEAEARAQLLATGGGTAARLDFGAANGFAGEQLWRMALLNAEPRLHQSVIYDGANRRLAGSEAGAKSERPADLALLNVARKTGAAQLKSGPGGDFLAGAFPFRLATINTANPTGIVYLEWDLHPQNDFLLVKDFRRVGMAGGLALVLIVLAWVYLNQTLTRRIACLIAATRDIAAGNLARRSVLSGLDELAELGAAFNQMATQIQAHTEELTESEERHRRIVETAYEGIFILDAEQRLSFVNRRLAEMLGQSIDALVGRTLEDFMFPEDWPDHRSRLARRQFHAAIRYERRLRRKDGGELWIIMSVAIRRDAGGEFTGAFGMATDITERKLAEDKLLLQSRALMASANAIIITDPAGGVEWVNPAFTRLTGYTEAEALGQKTNFLKSGQHPPEFYARLWSTIQQGKIWQGEITNRRRDQTLYTENTTIAPVTDKAGNIRHYVAVKEDVTERRALELQLQQAQKMEAVSNLAGGLAHEFNNLFTVILGYANILQSAGNLTAEDTAKVAEISASARRAANVTRQLLIFSRQQIMSPQPLNLNETVSRLFNILKHVLGEKIAVEYHQADALPAVFADPGMMEQIVINLTARARDAMPDGGQLTLTTQAVALDAFASSTNPEARRGRFVCLAVADTGANLEPENIRRIFEPFVAGKFSHSHNGLGLATVYGIVQEHRGWMEVARQPNQGTVFKVFLPVAETTAVPLGEVAPTFLPPAAASSKTILLVEDDDSLRKLVSACLRRANYRVLAAADSVATRQLWREHSASIDLLFTDIILPGDLDGHELAKKFKQERPGLKIIFSTGYSRARPNPTTDLLAGEYQLPKPYEPEMLIEVVGRALADSDPSAEDGQCGHACSPWPGTPSNCCPKFK
jgi:two-component system, cell cycle sensor histidine kinase and response regulator CckA